MTSLVLLHLPLSLRPLMRPTEKVALPSGSWPGACWVKQRKVHRKLVSCSIPEGILVEENCLRRKDRKMRPWVETGPLSLML